MLSIGCPTKRAAWGGAPTQSTDQKPGGETIRWSFRGLAISHDPDPERSYGRAAELLGHWQILHFFINGVALPVGQFGSFPRFPRTLNVNSARDSSNLWREVIVLYQAHGKVYCACQQTLEAFTTRRRDALEDPVGQPARGVKEQSGLS